MEALVSDIIYLYHRQHPFYYHPFACFSLIQKGSGFPGCWRCFFSSLPLYFYVAICCTFILPYTTPRQAKRYQNDLTFILPLLKDEINTVDLLLLEGIKIFYPNMYDHIRQNPELFVDTYLFREVHRRDGNGKLKEAIKAGYIGLQPDEAEAFNELILYLFPLLESVFRNVSYGSEGAERWRKQKRLCSGHYFNRYFYYTVPSNDIPDVSIEELFNTIENRPIEVIKKEVESLITQEKAENLTFKLHQNIHLLTAEGAAKLTLALCGLGGLFPKPEAVFSLSTPFSRAASFIADALNIVPDQSRLTLAYEIVQNAEPLIFGAEIIRWLRTGEEPKAISDEEADGLFSILANRIATMSKETNIITDSKSGGSLLWIWLEYGESEEVERYLTELISGDPQQAILLLKCFVGTAWSMSDGIPRLGDLESQEYINICKYVKPETVCQALCKIYDLSNPKQWQRSLAPEERIANDFMYIHQHIQDGGDDE